MPTILPFLSALVSIGLVYYAYRNHKSSQTKIVPSLFFLKKLKPRAPRSRKRKLPFRFFLEALFIILITSILLLANDLSNQKKYRLILDISQSMGTKSGNVTRLELAKSDLLNFVNSQDPSAEYYLETIPPSSETNKELISKASVENELKSIQTNPIPDDFSKLGELEYSFTDSFVFTDKKIQGNSVTQKSVYHSPESNLALSSIKVQSSGSEKLLVVNYFFSGSGSNSFDLEVKKVSSSTVIYRGKVEVLSPGRASISISLSGDFSNDNFYLATLSNSLQIDSLDSDNNLFFSSKEESSQEILLVSTNSSDSRELLSLKPILSAASNIVSEKDFKKLPKETLEKSPLHLFYKTSMPEAILAPSVVILPTSSSSLLDIKGIIKEPKISSWSDTSQLTRYINFENLNILSALSFKETSWGNTIVRANGAGSVIEGQSGGLPLVVSGIELLPFEGKKSPSASILLLNILKKLENTKQLDLVEPLVLNKDEASTNLATKRNYTEFSILPTGLYQVTSAKNKKYEISNAYNLQESDSRALNEEIVSIKKGISKPKILEDKLLFYLALISITVLLLDLLLILILGREV